MPPTTPPIASFYVTGGNLRGDASCYVPRRADRDLYEGLKSGEFCYVLTSRQMGKSSLMVRTAQRLRQENVDVVLLDLTAIGQNVTVEQWYDGLLQHLGQQLRLEDELDQFWQDHVRLAPLQRWMRALREVVLPQCRTELVVFVDEIDAVHSLPFSTDEFFAAIRECYNRRAEDAELSRLTFCLLGVATPSDLISDARTTPFNIGRRIELLDFTEKEAAPLAQGLGREERFSAKLLQRILYWTGGHPYLTQRLCLAVAQDPSVVRPTGVDRVCEGLFLSHGARERDNNLLFVRERMLRSEVDRAGLLDLYYQVRRRRRVPDDETNPLASVLRLSGITRVVKGYLWVRNRIYYRVFDREWVMANMPDAEKRRQRRAYRRGLMRASAVAAGLFALIGAIRYWYMDAKVWEHSAYYNSLARRSGVFEGVGPLSPADVAVRAVSFKVTTNGRYGEVVRVQAVNSRDELTPDHSIGTYLRYASANSPLSSRECQWEFVRDSAGKVIYEKALNKYGQQVWAFVYVPTIPRDGSRRGHYVGPRGVSLAQTAPLARSPANPKVDDGKSSEKVKSSTDRTGSGDATNAAFSTHDAQPSTASGEEPESTAKASSPEYVEIEYSPSGYEQYWRYFDSHDRPSKGLDGAYGIRFRYDEERGLLLEKLSLDRNNREMIDASGNCGLIFEGYDAFGNPAKVRSVDTDGQPKSVQGWAWWKATYDEHGRRVEVAYFDEHDKRVKVTDDNDKRLKTDGLFSKVRYTYDDRGNVTEEVYFDEKEQPAHRDGYAKLRGTYDERGQVRAVTYCDAADRPVMSRFGYAGWTNKYDERGNLKEQAYFGLNNVPVLHPDGYAKCTYEYDERGNLKEKAFYNSEDKLTKIPDGYARYKTKYDDRGNETVRSYYDEEGRPARHTHGNSVWAREYDDRGSVIEEIYSGFDVAKFLYFEQRYKYDERGRIIEIANFNDHHEPVQDKDGHARWTTGYDDQDHSVDRTFYDKDNIPAPFEDGYTGWHKKYENGKLVEQIFYGYDPSKGFTRRVAQFDEKGRRVRDTYLDAKGNLARTTSGYSKWIRIYNDRDILAEAIFAGYDAKKYGYARQRIKYDERGNITEIANFDDLGRPAHDKDGHARWTTSYDDQNHPIDQAYFDKDDKPAPFDDGYTRTQRKYKDGRLVERIYSGYDPAKFGFAKVVVKYDERGFQAERTFFDRDDKPALHKGGYARKIYVFDDGGNLTDALFYDFQDHLLAVKPLVMEVNPGGQGASLPLKEGDVFLKYDGTPLTSSTRLIARRKTEPAAGPARELVVRRGDQILTFLVRPGPLDVWLDDQVVADGKTAPTTTTNK